MSTKSSNRTLAVRTVAAALIAASALWLTSRRRHRAFMAQVQGGREPRIDGAVALVLISAGVATAGMLGLAATLSVTL